VTTDLAPRPSAPAAGTVVWRPTAFAPRASERALATLGALCLNAFLAAQFFSLTRVFFIRHVGKGLATAASQAAIDSVALLFPALLVYGREAGSFFGTLTRPARFWASGLLVLAAFFFLYGWLGKSYLVSAVVQDVCPYLVIVAAVVLGSNRRVWKDVNAAMVGLFLAGIVLSAVGMTETTRVVPGEFGEDRAGPAIVAYRMQGALAFWPLLFLTARLRRPLTQLLVFAGVFFVFGQQILVQERGPSVRVLVYMVVFLVVLPRLLRRESSPKGKRHLAALVATGAVAVMVAFSAGPWLLESQAGYFMPTLKGGLALALVCYAGLAYALWRGPRALREPLGAAAFFVVLVQTLFLLQEGGFTMSVSYDLFAVGLCMGYLLSRERDRGPDRGARVILVGHWPPAVAA
jgi:hypothetical protein